MICGPLVNGQIKANGYVTNKEFHNGVKLFLKPRPNYRNNLIHFGIEVHTGIPRFTLLM